jgi:hypothetical protein
LTWQEWGFLAALSGACAVVAAGAALAASPIDIQRSLEAEAHQATPGFAGFSAQGRRQPLASVAHRINATFEHLGKLREVLRARIGVFGRFRVASASRAKRGFADVVCGGVFGYSPK